MISTACLSWSSVIVPLPSAEVGIRITWVPPLQVQAELGRRWRRPTEHPGDERDDDEAEDERAAPGTVACLASVCHGVSCASARARARRWTVVPARRDLRATGAASAVRAGPTQAGPEGRARESGDQERSCSGRGSLDPGVSPSMIDARLPSGVPSAGGARPGRRPARRPPVAHGHARGDLEQLVVAVDRLDRAVQARVVITGRRERAGRTARAAFCRACVGRRMRK